MYGLYHTSYKISDEIKFQKENEQPFWWSHLHPEVRDKKIEEIDEMLADANVPADLIKSMPRKEKYLAVSAGCYCIDHAQFWQQIEDAKLKNGTNEGDPGGGAGSNTPSASGRNPIAFSGGDESSNEGGAPGHDLDLDEDGFKKRNDPLAPGMKDVDGSGTAPGGNLPPAGNAPSLGNANKTTPVEIRKIAQSIVRDAVNKINSRAEEIPVETNPEAEMDILRAVISELQTLSHGG